MRLTMWTCALALVLVCGAVAAASEPAAPAMGEPAEALPVSPPPGLEEMAAQLEQVRLTPDAADDIRLAAQMLAAVGREPLRSPAQSWLLRRAYYLAAPHRDAIEQVFVAQDLMLLQAIGDRAVGPPPGRPDPAKVQRLSDEAAAIRQRGERERAVSLYLDALAAAQAPAARYTILQPLMEIVTGQLAEQEVSEARQRASQPDAQPEHWRYLLHLELVERHDLEAAIEAAQSAPVPDPDTVRLIGLARRPLAELSAEESLELARWYRELGLRASPFAIEALYACARQHYAAYGQAIRREEFAFFASPLEIAEFESTYAQRMARAMSWGHAIAHGGRVMAGR